MHLHCGMRPLKLCTILWLLSILVIAVLTGLVTGADSDANQRSIEYEIHPHSSLTGDVLELASVDDRDDTSAYFQPPFYRHELKRAFIEDYRLANSQNLALPELLLDSNEVLLDRHKRDVTWIFDTAQTLSVDGSGSVTDEESTEPVTIATSITMNVSGQAELPTTTLSSTSQVAIYTDTSLPTSDGTSLVTIVESTSSTTTSTITIVTDVTIEESTSQTSTTTTVSTATTTESTSTTTIAVRPQVCTWTNWLASSNCTPTCGLAYRSEIRSCIDTTTTQSCDGSLCGGGSAMQNTTCTFSPPCETISPIPGSTIRDPRVRIIPYLLPDSMYFFEQTYRRIWISNKGYITFGTPFYGRTMTASAFNRISEQAIAAPFWADLLFDNSSSSMTINWFSSTEASGSDANQYYDVIQSAISSACPTSFCSSQYAAARVIRVHWQNLIYELPHSRQSMNISFSAYLINTYESEPSYGQPLLRSYIAFDYADLPSNLQSLRPFVGLRGKYQMIRVLNDPSYHLNAAFLTDGQGGRRRRRSFYVGGRFLSECEVSYLRETRMNILHPWENLNDIRNNPRFPCPCTLGQAQRDRRFGRLQSETAYETSQDVVCYGPMIDNWIRMGWSPKLLKPQTCCYHRRSQDLITSGALAGSVLSDGKIIFRRHPWQRRISFYDQCCAPSHSSGTPNWGRCRLYYQLHPPSSCTGYRPPAIVGGVGDPHVDTIDSGRYTCHIQGVYVFAQTTVAARQRAEANVYRNISDMNLIYPNDLFQIHVRSMLVAPALSYIERTQGYGSIFTSYMIITDNVALTISNNNGKFANNLNYDYTNANDSTISDTEPRVYRLTQTIREVMNRTVPQLTLTLWSGVAIQCEIVGENLECVLSLPDKFRTFIEGLAGNFNGDPNDDLFNRQTNKNVTILSSSNLTASYDDNDVLDACQSWRVFGDSTPGISMPIMPRSFVKWFYTNGSRILADAYPLLNETIVDETCAGQFECVHDYLIRTNSFTSRTTASALSALEDARKTSDMPPTPHFPSSIRITLPINETNREYAVRIDFTPDRQTNITGINAVTFPSNITQHVPVSGGTIMIGIPNDTTSSVEVLLSVTYGRNGILEKYLHLIVCLCTNGGTCDFEQPLPITQNYEIAACDCPPQYDDDLCQSAYNACASSSPCRVNWIDGTSCVALSPTEQLLQNRSHYCDGRCLNGYNSTDGYTCEDVDECELDPLRCGNGTCENLDGSYACNCTIGYRLDNQTCVDVNECTEPDVDGSFPRRCEVDGEVCVNMHGTYRCECSSIFNSTGSCIYNASACNGDTCTDDSGVILCLHGTVNVNDICIPWCNSTCPGFCDLTNNTYACDCMKYPGFEYSEDGKRCVPCRGLNYGYGCLQSCECVNGVCNRNASHENDSCICTAGYRAPDCAQLIDACENSNACNSATEVCRTNPSNTTAICTCRLGYEKNESSGVCVDIDECRNATNICHTDSSNCINSIGSYSCSCKDGYQSVNGACNDINECEPPSAGCKSYTNTDCANIQGSYECRCNFGYAVGGDKNRLFENILNTSNVCLPTNLCPDSSSVCIGPAYCDPTTGRCRCEIPVLNLVPATNPSKETCQCPGHPFVQYQTSVCDSPIGQTWFLLFFAVKPRTRYVTIYSPRVSNLTTEVSRILAAMNKTCDDSCVHINETNAENTAREYFIALNLPLNATERLQFANRFFQSNLSINSSYAPTLRMIINSRTRKLETFNGPVGLCRECDFLDSGTCTNESDDACRCFSGYEGYLCRIDTTTKEPVLRASEARKWIIIVGVISAVAGLLLILACFLCLIRIISNFRRIGPKAAKYAVGRETYFIPRAHVPTMGTVGRDLLTWDGFSLSTSDDRYNETSDSYPSSSTTTYNPTYRIDGASEQADYTIFDNLEKRTPLSRAPIPRAQMAGMTGTLNSFPHDRTDHPNGIFLDSNDLDETELVTDMVEDMTKDDDRSDQFLEAVNPNVVIPTATLQPGVTTSTRFSVE